jgi:dihydropteroate synthase
MGILNVTPDSFSDGGRFTDTDRAVAHAEAMAAQGADLLDIGGESSRPGSEPVPAEEELRRVIPVIRRLAKRLRIPISIDTTKASVARAALSEGAAIINDISALQADPEMIRTAVETGGAVVLMHMQGRPKTMQDQPAYRDVVREIRDFLTGRVAAAREGGIPSERIAVDPGIGFGKTLPHNLEILRRLSELDSLGLPVLVGPSRKSFIGTVLDLPVEERLEGTAAAVAAAVLNGARILRVHDVEPMRRVVRIAEAIRYGADLWS